MPHYLNPATELPNVGRLLKPSSGYRGYAQQLKEDEHLFCFAYRGRNEGEYPQAAYIWDSEQYGEYKSALFNCWGIAGYYALPKTEWDRHFAYVPERYAQARPPKPQMVPLSDLFNEERGE